MGTDIIAFGDSLTQGCYYEYEGSCGKEATSFLAYDYSSYLETFFINDDIDISVKNFGVGGEQTWQGVNRLDYVLSNECNKGVAFVLIMEGTNDLFHHMDPSVVYYNLGLMVDIVVARGEQPLLATIPPDPENPYKKIGELNALIRDLAIEKDVILVEQYYGLVENWHSYTNPRGCYLDQTHPNIIGFRDIAGIMYGSLANLPEFNSTEIVPLSWLNLLLKSNHL